MKWNDLKLNKKEDKKNVGLINGNRLCGCYF